MTPCFPPAVQAPRRSIVGPSTVRWKPRPKSSMADGDNAARPLPAIILFMGRFGKRPTFPLLDGAPRSNSLSGVTGRRMYDFTEHSLAEGTASVIRAGRTRYYQQLAMISNPHRFVSTLCLKLPSAELHSGFPPQKIDLKEYTSNKSVIIVGLPGAFTPTCE